MAHIAQYVEDSQGDLVDLVYVCSDYCNRSYHEREGTPYEGWNGCHEISYDEQCAYCYETIKGVNEHD